MDKIRLKENTKSMVNGMLKHIKWTKLAGITSISMVEGENSIWTRNEEDRLTFCMYLPVSEKKHDGIFEVDFTDDENEYGEHKVNCSIMFFPNEEDEELADIIEGYRRMREKDEEELCSYLEFMDGDWVYDGDSKQVAEEIVEELENSLKNGLAMQRLNYFLDSGKEKPMVMLFEYYNTGQLLSHAISRAEEAQEFIENQKPKMVEAWAKEAGQTIEDFRNNTGLMNNLEMTLKRQALDYYIYS